MKRLFLAVGLAAFMMTSCCESQGNKENANAESKCEAQKEQCDHHHGPKCPEMTAEDRAEIEGIIEAFKGWDNLDEAQKTTAIATAKARVEKCEAKKAEMEAAHQCCKPEGEHKCEGKHEGCKHECNHEGMPEAPKCEGMMTKEECDAKWAAFDTLTLDEQKAVLCCKLHHCPGFMMVMHEKCAPKHECNHEGTHKCEGNHEGCQHQCNHEAK